MKLNDTMNTTKIRTGAGAGIMVACLIMTVGSFKGANNSETPVVMPDHFRTNIHAAPGSRGDQAKPPCITIPLAPLHENSGKSQV